MAVKEIRDYLENGNIKNSVNYPNCDMGTCVAVGRISLAHSNTPNMIVSKQESFDPMDEVRMMTNVDAAKSSIFQMCKTTVLDKLVRLSEQEMWLK